MIRTPGIQLVMLGIVDTKFFSPVCAVCQSVAVLRLPWMELVLLCKASDPTVTAVSKIKDVGTDD